ncbi:class I SAM-dependent methyltransferase [Cronbergia sp. UHCC 0137]|uniref:class I SAM-dependent methyltransferase n=1 Tax=Cronbergia sp. UHCC 0137 TaxID=3110239 RepID=UPI002B20DD84|nr:class I SAM-dependent methyltransferase [Cronbergia sp. UHCC 0137]MEA5620801.1 class I SAM-dependent methyltransferase [Cronbergia sp. UHCC 0137]
MKIINEKPDLLKLNPVIHTLISGQTVVGRSDRIHQTTGISTINNLVVISNLMNEMQATSTLEIEMAYGASTLVFCAMHLNLNLKESEHIAIDPFQFIHYDDCGVINVQNAKLDRFLKIYYEHSCYVLPQLIKQDKKYDLIYIDGSHLFEDAFLDAYFALRLLRSGGVMLIDDSTDPHVAKVISFLRKNLCTAIEEIDLTEYRLRTEISPKYYLARKFRRVQLTGFRLIGKIDRSYGTALVNF